MSRWFKIIFVLMVLFVIRMGIKLHMNQPSELDDPMKAGIIYNAYQSNPEIADDKYGGERVTVEGRIVDVVGNGSYFTIILSGQGASGREVRMIECYPSEVRHYKANRFDIGQFASVYGEVRENQDGGLVKIDKCQIFTI